MLDLSGFHFQKHQRLLNKRDYGYVFNAAKKISTRWFTILYRPSQYECPRLGLVISKKSAKRAVDRNQIKRYLRETFRLSQHDIQKFDIVVMSKKGITDADQQLLVSELGYIWRKLSRIA